MVSLQIDQKRSLESGQLITSPQLPFPKRERELWDFFAHHTLVLEGQNLVVNVLTKVPLRVSALCFAHEALASCQVYAGGKWRDLAQNSFACIFLEPLVVFQGIAYLCDTPMANSLFLRFAKQSEISLALKEIDHLAQILEDDLILDKEEIPPQKKLGHVRLCDPYGCTAFCADEEIEEILREVGYREKWRGESNYYCPQEHVRAALDALLELSIPLLNSQGHPIKRVDAIDLQFARDGMTVSCQGSLQVGEESVCWEKTKPCWQRQSFLMPLASGGSALLPPVEQLPFAPETIYPGKGFRIPWGALTPHKGMTLPSDLLPPERANPSHGFQGTLRPYQQEGFALLWTRYTQDLGLLLADEMGLGKTVQILSFLSQVAGPTLIVMPYSLMSQWRYEISRFLPHLAVDTYHGPERFLGTASIVLTTYTILRDDIESLGDRYWDVVILDEAQMIKNPKSLTSIAAKRLQARSRIAMTGTPIENRLEEIHSIYGFVLPKLLEGNEGMEQMRQKIAPFFLRRTKRDVLEDLPERIDQTIWIQLCADEMEQYQRLYQRLKQTVIERLDAGTLEPLHVLEVILRLRQFCVLPALVDPSLGMGTKWEKMHGDLIEIFDENEKVLLFSQFTTFLRHIAPLIQVPHVLLEGATKNRSALIDAFQNDKNVLLFLCSLKAGGVGLNLTQSDYVFLTDPWWNRAAEEQAIGRAHRIGRQSRVICRRYLVKDTIEEKILAMQEDKHRLSQSFDETTPQNIQSLDTLLELLL